MGKKAETRKAAEGIVHGSQHWAMGQVEPHVAVAFAMMFSDPIKALAGELLTGMEIGIEWAEHDPASARAFLEALEETRRGTETSLRRKSMARSRDQIMRELSMVGRGTFAFVCGPEMEHAPGEPAAAH